MYVVLYTYMGVYACMCESMHVSMCACTYACMCDIVCMRMLTVCVRVVRSAWPDRFDGFDRLIPYLNSEFWPLNTSNPRIKARVSTMAEYVDAVFASRHAWPLYTGDFMPYCSSESADTRTYDRYFCVLPYRTVPYRAVTKSRAMPCTCAHCWG